MICSMCGRDIETFLITTPKGLLGSIDVCKDCESVVVELIKEKILEGGE